MEKRKVEPRAFNWSRGVKYIRTQMDIQIDENPVRKFVALRKADYLLLLSKLNDGFKFEYQGREIKKMGAE